MDPFGAELFKRVAHLTEVLLYVVVIEARRRLSPVSWPQCVPGPMIKKIEE